MVFIDVFSPDNVESRVRLLTIEYFGKKNDSHFTVNVSDQRLFSLPFVRSITSFSLFKKDRNTGRHTLRQALCPYLVSPSVEKLS